MKNENGYVVYGGNGHFTFKDFNIIPWKRLNDLHIEYKELFFNEHILWNVVFSINIKETI